MTQYLKTDFEYNTPDFVDVFDELPIWAAPFGLKLLDCIQYRKGISALDIGFGAGFPLTEIAMRLGSSSKIYGIDPWHAAVDRAEKKINYYGIKNVKIIRGVAEDIPIRSDSIDLITSNNGLNNVADLKQSLSECARIMKQGGQFIQTMNLNETMIEFYDAMKEVFIDLNLNKCLDKMQDQIYKQRKPLEEYINAIKKVGFSVTSVQHDQFQYHFVDGTTMLNHYFIRMAFLDGWKHIVPFEQQTEVFEMIEMKLNEQAERNGVFKLTVPFVVIDCLKN